MLQNQVTRSVREVEVRDPIEENEADRERELDEEARELRWTAFVEVVLTYAESDGWPAAIAAFAWAMTEGQETA